MHYGGMSHFWPPMYSKAVTRRAKGWTWPPSTSLRASAPPGSSRWVAEHPRCHGRGHQILNLEHYLDVLERKPGAMAAGGALAGVFGCALEITGTASREKQGHARDDRAGARRHGRGSPRAGRFRRGGGAAYFADARPKSAEQACVGVGRGTGQFERPLPVMDDYDLLLAGTAGGAQ